MLSWDSMWVSVPKDILSSLVDFWSWGQTHLGFYSSFLFFVDKGIMRPWHLSGFLTIKLPNQGSPNVVQYQRCPRRDPWFQLGVWDWITSNTQASRVPSSVKFKCFSESYIGVTQVQLSHQPQSITFPLHPDPTLSGLFFCVVPSSLLGC